VFANHTIDGEMCTADAMQMLEMNYCEAATLNIGRYVFCPL